MNNLLDTLSVSCNLCTVEVKNLLNMNNSQVTKAYNNSLVGTSEAIRMLNLNKVFTLSRGRLIHSKNEDTKLEEWLAGIIDGDGSFLLSKKGYASLEITMDIRDEHALQIVKNTYGGSIKLRSGANALRYRLHHKSGLLKLINDVNGHIRNSNRLVQLNKLCHKYEISLIYPQKLTFYSGWLSGFFDACGKLDLNFTENNTKPKLILTVTHRLYDTVVMFKDIFGGYVVCEKGNSDRFVWYLDSDDKILNFLEYVKRYPLRSSRRQRFFLIPGFYKLLNLRAYKASEGTILGKTWSRFNLKFSRGIHTMSIHSSQKELINKSSLLKLSNDFTQRNKLVVWGENLGSGISYGRLTKQVSEMYKFNNYQYSVVIGLLLSDGWISYSTKFSKTPRLGFKQSLNKFNYLFLVFSILSPFCNSLPSIVTSKNKNLSLSYAVNFFTRSLPCIIDLHLLFYKNNKKVIPQNIYNLLDPIALAHWIMGDGQRRDYGLVLCTDSFSIAEVVRLENVLILRYDLICTIRTNKIGQYRIYISAKSMDKLISILLPYMDNSMLYKLNLVYNKK